MALAAAMIGGSAEAGLLERALMPGKVIRGHQPYEAECERCHSSFDKGQQPQLCLDCHKEVASDIQGTHGLHGRQSSQRCVDCHSEHLGADASIVRLDQSTFDHALTDFALTGKHQAAQCSGCHAAGRKHREANSSCVSCHHQDNRHQSKLGDGCGDCHATSGWKTTTSFDHGLTGFRLLGAHARVECGLCHAESAVSKRLRHDCLSCHRQDDPHRGSMGEDCAQCHVESDWKTARFDHRQTGFVLLGKHAEASCGDCHQTRGEYRGAPETCAGCHGKDDRHRGTLGDRCESCHDSSQWQRAPGFDHSRTRFVLVGGHLRSDCKGCHVDAAHFRDTSTACVDCHRQDDSHKGRNGLQCGDCHDARDWKTSLFDHDRATEFVLRGSHRKASCEACHIEAVTAVKPGAQCIDCHLADDVHQTRLGRQCGDCHQEQDWKSSTHNHDLGKFPLIGGHRQVACGDCHRTQLFADTDGACSSCHRKDDAHGGRYGTDCGRCHVARDWQIWDFDHSSTAFALSGAHQRTRCASCHSPSTGPKLSRQCVSCHAQDDVHEGGFGRRCARCHTTTSFSEVISRVSGQTP
ncbi:MAG: hypothetical protein AB7E72_18155 [Lysobacterales bacterium]